MALFIIEREFAEELEISADDVRGVIDINNGTNVNWLTSFLSADRRKTYCLYEADSPDDLLEAARQANLPATAIVELTGQIDPNEIVNGS